MMMAIDDAKIGRWMKKFTMRSAPVPKRVRSKRDRIRYSPGYKL
jgi:hypothetical protein